MQFRTVSIWVLGLTAAIAVLPSYARGVIVDGSKCPTYLPMGSQWIDITGTGDSGNRAKAGLNLPILNCVFASGFTGYSSLDYDPSHSFFYTLVDLAAAQDDLAGVINAIAQNGLTLLPPPPSAPDSSATLVAEVLVLKLTGTYKGGYEIEFNYQTGNLPATACQNVTKPIKPTFTWFNTTYVFTGVGGVTACDPASTNDFVFGRNGNLLGYLSATGTLTAGLPPGWVTQ